MRINGELAELRALAHQARRRTPEQVEAKRQAGTLVSALHTNFPNYTPCP